MKIILIKSDFITITQFLKITNLINTGGESKIFIHENIIRVNGFKTIERNKKLFDNDEIEINKNKYKIKNI